MSKKMMNKLTKIIVIIVLIIGIIFIASIFLNTQGKEDKTGKNQEQIEYLDTKLVSLINSLNNIELQNYKITQTKVEAKNSTQGSSSESESSSKNQGSKDQDKGQSGSNKEETEISKLEEESIVTKNEEAQPNWNTIESELEILYSTWPTIILDLQNIRVSKEDILGFSSTLDETILNAKNKEKALTALYMAKLYGYLPRFIDENSADDVKMNAIITKAYLINAYAYAETENFDKMSDEITKGEAIFAGMVNDAKYVEDDRKYNINKAYVLLGELKNSLTTKDKGIFYVKYKNTLEELDILS